MRYDREHLETLRAVVEEGTLDAAAQRLRITPSAVSQRLKAFEHQVGRVLVVRSKPARATGPGEELVRMARQLALLEHEADQALGGADGPTTIPIAVNADSLATWILPALERVTRQHPIAFEMHRDDQDHTAGWLANGTVMGAVTSQAEPVPGCTSTPLGRMRYRPRAAPAFAARWFADGPDAASLALAPVVVFDEKDHLQSRYLRMATRRRLEPPRHRVPASADFALAVRLGLGWGMLPDAQAEGTIEFDPARGIDVALYWQQWNLRSPLLDAVAAEVVATARSTFGGRVAAEGGVSRLSRRVSAGG
jgi:LysR family transcriptional regulator (chromosome initiation inhibitor)